MKNDRIVTFIHRRAVWWVVALIGFFTFHSSFFTLSEVIGDRDAPGVGSGLGVVPGLVEQFVGELMPGEVSSLADRNVVGDGSLEMISEGDAYSEVDAEHGLLQGELLGVAILDPMDDVVAHIETELRTGLDEYAQDIADTCPATGIALNQQALLLEYLFLNLQIALVVECCDVD